MTSSPQKQQLYCLYGSQTGNSEQAAEDFCRQIPEKFTPEFFKQHNLPHVQVETTCIQLDDFLELRNAEFTKCLVIFVSSYGVGQAPLGAYRFRSLTDKLAEGAYPSLLKGLSYAICGLGDSTYPTYLQNPTTIDKGLTSAGASRVGDLGKADAHQIGDKAQDKVIAKWVEGLWVPLAKALTDTSKRPDLVEMQKSTISILQELDPDFKKSSGGFPPYIYVVGVLVALIAILMGSGVLKL
jgi:sulfite reductase alpha subunit-like flavoprotein